MCVDGIGRLLVADEKFQELTSNPHLDLVHKQVLMTLYSLDANHKLKDYRSILPRYLGMELSKCDAILDVIERAGLISRQDDTIDLLYKIENDTHTHGCGCG